MKAKVKCGCFAGVIPQMAAVLCHTVSYSKSQRTDMNQAWHFKSETSGSPSNILLTFQIIGLSTVLGLGTTQSWNSELVRKLTPDTLLSNYKRIWQIYLKRQILELNWISVYFLKWHKSVPNDNNAFKIYWEVVTWHCLKIVRYIVVTLACI